MKFAEKPFPEMGNAINSGQADAGWIIWAAITLLGALGYVVNSLFVPAERRILRWHRQAARS
ncbi:hypothetical protein ABGB18_40655 [Nonomuraea sp. B12E4]|uniref:hypothetical protein n=1 Tax=Nonomuraea sp. B12E4 TaxID=3153564 RepID=UPI00325D5059